jgi:hypothetical protein
LSARSLEADVQVRDLSLGQRDDLYAGKRHAFEHAIDILLVAADPIEGLSQHHLESAAQRVCEQHLDTGADQRGAGDSPVMVAVGHQPALLLCMDPAQSQLILDRGLALLIGGVAA